MKSSLQDFNKHWLTAILLLTACSQTPENEMPKQQPTGSSGEVHLAMDSPKKAYVKTAILKMSQHPLLEPIAGKVSYNESLTARIGTPVSGRVVSTPIALGAEVRAGTVLLELDSPDVADTESDFAKAQANLALAEKVLERQQVLYSGKAIARKELETAQNAFHDALSELQRTRARLRNLHIRTNQNDGLFSLRATLPGVVVEKNVNPGGEVRPDRETPLFVTTDVRHLTLLMEVYEVNIGKIKHGQNLSISVPAYPNESFPATVQYIGQVLDETTRTIQVRCELPNPDGRLMPGMYATVNVESDVLDQAIVIPLTAVFTEGDEDYVFIAQDENNFKQRRIEIGLRLKDKAVIAKGLQPNELLVTEGALMLRTEEEVESDVQAKS